MVITQDDSTMVLNDGVGIPRMLYLDGRKSEEIVPGGTAVEVSTRWKGGKLTVERKFPDGSSVREMMNIDKDSHRLIVEMKVASPSTGQTLEFRRVYDPAS
jgi:hypothetical protein